MLYVGNDQVRTYMEMGRGIEAVNIAENMCERGDTVVSPSAWIHCRSLAGEYYLMADGKHIKVITPTVSDINVVSNVKVNVRP